MRHLNQLLIACFISSCVGCAMCDDSADYGYHAYGGMRDRIDRVNGRVGSIFDPAAALEPVLAVEETLPSLPTSPDKSSGGSSDGSVDDSGITDELLEGLRKFGELPDVPGADNSNGSLDEAEQSDVIDFDEI